MAKIIVSAYLFAGFSIFLTLRLALHGSSFCLIRFQIPEHLFSLYVDRIHNSMQLFTLFGSAFGTAVIRTVGKVDTEGTSYAKEYCSIASNWALFCINVVILIAFVVGGKNGCITFFYWSMAFSSFIFATNMQFILSMAGANIVWYLASENSTQILTSFLHWILLLFCGNRRKYYTEFVVIVWQIAISAMVTGVSAILWTLVYYLGAANALRHAADAIGKLIIKKKTTRDRLVTKGDAFKNAVCGVQTEASELQSSCPALDNLKSKAEALHGLIPDSPGTAVGAHEKAKKALEGARDAVEKLKAYASTLQTAGSGGACETLRGLAQELDGAANELAKPGCDEDKLRKLKEAIDAVIGALGDAIDTSKNCDTALGQIKGALNTAASNINTQCTNGDQAKLLKVKEAANKLATKAYQLTDLKSQLINLRDALNSAADAIAVAFACRDKLDALKSEAVDLKTQAKNIAGGGSSSANEALAVSPMAMCFFGLGMVFAFYPAIAPGMLVEFRLVHRVDMILLLVSPIPSVLIALLSEIAGQPYNANVNPALNAWTSDKGAVGWHACHIFTVTEILCAILFIITLHYLHLSMSKNLRRPFWACVVSIVFYMSQEILAAVGFAGVTGNAGKDHYLNELNNFFIRLSMIIFIFFAEGYIVILKV